MIVLDVFASNESFNYEESNVESIHFFRSTTFLSLDSVFQIDFRTGRVASKNSWFNSIRLCPLEISTKGS